MKKRSLLKYGMIPLTNGGYVAVDWEDYDDLMRYKWNQCGQGYAMRMTSETVEGKRRQWTVMMHRLLGRAAEGWDTHHIDEDKWDNRKANLQPKLRSEHIAEHQHFAGPRRGRFKGVTRCGRRWQARIQTSEKTYRIGLFHSEEAAACAYNRQARALWGNACFLNNVGGDSTGVIGLEVSNPVDSARAA